MQHLLGVTRGARLLTALVTAALLVLGAAACAGPPEDTSDTSQDTVVEDGGAPATEDTGAREQPDNSADRPVAVELPGLPIGGSSVVVSDTLQCVDVGWTTPPDLPKWLSIAVTGVELQPDDGFALSSEPCASDFPSCLTDGFRLSSSDRCYVAVTWTGPTLDSDRTLAFTSGRVLCPPDRVEECLSFREDVASAGPQRIGLEPAPSELADTSTVDGGDGGG